MELRGLGAANIDLWKRVLNRQSPGPFLLGAGMAYLNDTSEVDALGETAIKNKNFRVYALAALASIDQPASHLKLAGN